MVRLAQSETTTDRRGLTIIREMKTLHIHISGRVQGVGFRPAVYRIATEMHLSGSVSNTADGVHIYLNADNQELESFLRKLNECKPEMSIISSIITEEQPFRDFDGFSIAREDAHTQFNMWITPDLALCDDCRQAIHDPANHRFGYAFTTCLNCGPRYSILRKLPYERENTAMLYLTMCPSCNREYNRSDDIRFYSQTNSCPDCGVKMSWLDAKGQVLSTDQAAIVAAAMDKLRNGAIVAVKGIGGYLLLCDATSPGVVEKLRERKHRPAKPLALLYPDLNAVQGDVLLSQKEIAWLQSPAAPIVLGKIKDQPASSVALDKVAPSLAHLGVMLPYNPLLELISTGFGRPLVATSANISGCPIEYNDDSAIEKLGDIADYFLINDREIVVPQDDSVLRVSTKGKTIMIRRSRGFAPAVVTEILPSAQEGILAMGADMKNSFAVHFGKNLNVSQYLGKLGSYESLVQVDKVLKHILDLTAPDIEHVLTDAHPNYHSTSMGAAIAREKKVKLHLFQHHKAHFASVLAENHLLESKEPVLGFVWDGTGYGDDGQIWGGETFLFKNGDINRLTSLQYFPQLAGDKMSMEPRLSALALAGGIPVAKEMVERLFLAEEFQYYMRLVNNSPLHTSSMGRLIDGFASLLGLCDIQTYEGEAAMKLEALAWRVAKGQPNDFYQFGLTDKGIDYTPALVQWIHEIQRGCDPHEMAKKFWYSLANLILQQSRHYNCAQMALSGGVFQNAFLVDALFELSRGQHQIYLHNQFSPNDENVAVGQLALFHLHNSKIKHSNIKTTVTCV